MVVDNILNRVKILENVTNDKEISIILGVPQRTLAGWKLRNRIPYEYIEKYVNERSISLDYIMEGRGFPYTQLVDLGDVPKTISINDMINIPLEDENHTDIISVPKNFLHNCIDETVTAYYMRDDSMQPTIRTGSIIFVSKKSINIKTGGIYRIKYDDEIFIKRIFKTDKGIYTLVSTDEKYPQWQLKHEDFKVLGTVVAITQKV